MAKVTIAESAIALLMLAGCRHEKRLGRCTVLRNVDHVSFWFIDGGSIRYGRNRRDSFIAYSRFEYLTGYKMLYVKLYRPTALSESAALKVAMLRQIVGELPGGTNA